MDNQDNTIETYNKIARAYSEKNFNHFWVKEFEYFKAICPGKKIVDIGCGAGRDASVLVESGFDYVGIDASEGMLAIASDRVKRGNFILMSFYNIDFPAESFDGFWAAASLLHIPKVKVNGVLDSIYKIIKPGGVGFISLKEKRDLDEGVIQESKYGGVSRYFAFYSIDEFTKTLERSNFEVIKVTTSIESDELKTKWLSFFVRRPLED